MQRYFYENIDKELLLNKEDSYHIIKVMRKELGDKIEIVSDKKVYITKIINIVSDLVTVEVIEEKETNNELKCEVVVAQALVKEQKMDYILQKATELGVSEIIPLETTRSIVKLDKKEDKKIIRWQSIAKEASEQSKRNVIPKINGVTSIKKLAELNNFKYKLLCTVNEASRSIKTVLSNIEDSDRILVVIGPEGGFDPKEEAYLMESGFISVSLGDRVLRTETASSFVLSCINYILMR